MSNASSPAAEQTVPRASGRDVAAAPVFVRCATCGRYLPREERKARRYCSEQCAERYHRCSVCGRYVPEHRVVRKEYCSRECASRFTINRSYGPRELGIRAEDLV